MLLSLFVYYSIPTNSKIFFFPKFTIASLFNPIFTNASARSEYDTRSIFKRSLTGFNSEFSFSWTSCLNKAEEPSLPYYLPIAGGRIIGLIPFPRVLVLCEMQSVSSRIWTRVAVSISYDDNHYTTGTSLFNGISTYMGYLITKPLWKKQQWYYSTHASGDKGFISFSKELVRKWW